MNCDHHVFDWCLEAIKYICECCLHVVKLGSLYPYKTNFLAPCPYSFYLCDECVVLERVASLIYSYKVPKTVWH